MAIYNGTSYSGIVSEPKISTGVSTGSIGSKVKSKPWGTPTTNVSTPWKGLERSTTDLSNNLAGPDRLVYNAFNDRVADTTSEMINLTYPHTRNYTVTTDVDGDGFVEMINTPLPMQERANAVEAAAQAERTQNLSRAVGAGLAGTAAIGLGAYAAKKLLAKRKAAKA